MQPNVRLLPAAYDAQRAAALKSAILHIHAVVAQAPDTEAKVLAARDAAGELATIALSMAERGRAMGDTRAAESIPHLITALRALVAVRALYEAEGAREVAA